MKPIYIWSPNNTKYFDSIVSHRSLSRAVDAVVVVVVTISCIQCQYYHIFSNKIRRKHLPSDRWLKQRHSRRRRTSKQVKSENLKCGYVNTQFNISFLCFFLFHFACLCSLIIFVFFSYFVWCVYVSVAVVPLLFLHNWLVSCLLWF